MKRIKDFIMLFRGKWCIWLITNIVTILLIFYVNIKFINLLKGQPHFDTFFVYMMCLPWLVSNLCCIKLDFELIKNKNRFFTLKDFFVWWCILNFTSLGFYAIGFRLSL